jgi:hypothetical protein
MATLSELGINKKLSARGGDQSKTTKSEVLLERGIGQAAGNAAAIQQK